MNDTTRAALAQSLDALREVENDFDYDWPPAIARKVAAAIAAAEAALAEPQGEPVAWTVSDSGRCIISTDDFAHDVLLRVSGDFENDDDRTAYAEWIAKKLSLPWPAPAEPLMWLTWDGDPETESNAQIELCDADSDGAFPVYAGPALVAQGEPVAAAWMQNGVMVNAFPHPPGDPTEWDRHGYWAAKGFSREPLFAAPSLVAHPLTDEQRRTLAQRIVGDDPVALTTAERLITDVERAHGITQKGGAA
jgi:hypothetical protein